VQVQIVNSQGTPVNKNICAAGGANSGSVLETGGCSSASNGTFEAASLTDRARMGAYVNPGGDVFIGVSGATAGGAANSWSDNQPNYSWAQWFTGGRAVTFILASPTPTSTPTSTPTATPGTSQFLPAAVTPVAFVDLSQSPLNPTRTFTGGPGVPTPVAAGLTLSGFYYPLQVWLDMVPTLGIAQPAAWCLGATCYEATTVPERYTYLGMSRSDGTLVSTTAYTQAFAAAPYSFTSTQYIKLFWEFPNIDDGLGLVPPRYYYTEQVPGPVNFHYQVRLRHTWPAAQTAAWPALPAPPCPGWAGPGTACVYTQDLTIAPGQPLTMTMTLVRPVIERN